MSTKRAAEPMTLGIQRIEPVQIDDPVIQSALERTRRSLRNPRLRDILTIRTAVQHYLCRSLVEQGYVHPPVYMTTGCTDPLNHWTYPARINYYGEETSICQSLILQKLLVVMLSPAERVFWASPNIRMEMRISHKEYKYATEFMQVDFEKRHATYDEMLTTVSDLVRGLYRFLNEHHAEGITRLRGEPLPELEDPLTVHDAAQYAATFAGEDHDDIERRLAEQADGKPFLLVNMAREAYDCFDHDRGRFLNYDVIIPPHGRNRNPVECLSGAERTRSLEDLEARMQDLGYPLDYFAPFFELYGSLCNGDGSITCAGGGFGIERLTYGLLGLADVHEVYPFPRLAEAKIAM